MISKDLQDKLIGLAKEAQEKAYVPYSKFPVGAALITEDEDIYTRCSYLVYQIFAQSHWPPFRSDA